MSKDTTHFLFSAFDKTTACGRSYRGLELTVHIDNSDCKSCKNVYKLQMMKKDIDSQTPTSPPLYDPSKGNY